jgi:hypothetical protein
MDGEKDGTPGLCSSMLYYYLSDKRRCRNLAVGSLCLLTSIATLSGSCLVVSSLLTKIVVIYLLDFRISSLCHVDKLLCNPCSL